MTRQKIVLYNPKAVFHTMPLALVALGSCLDPARFARIHRSTIVNLDRVRELRPDPHGDCDVVLENGAAYRLSRLHRARLMASFGGSSR